MLASNFLLVNYTATGAVSLSRWSGIHITTVTGPWVSHGPTHLQWYSTLSPPLYSSQYNTVQHSTATLLSPYSGGRHSTTGGQETIHNPGGPMMGTLQVGGHIRCQKWAQSTDYFLDVIHYLYGWWMMWILRTDTRLTTMNHEDRRREDVRKWKLGVTTWHQNGPGPGSTFSCTQHSPCHLNWTDTMSYSILFSYSVLGIITTLSGGWTNFSKDFNFLIKNIKIKQ